MCMYISVCIYMYLYTYKHIHACIYLHVCICINVYVYMSLCLYILMCMFMHVCIYMCTCMYLSTYMYVIFLYIYIYISVNVYIYIHMYTYICIYWICIRTQKYVYTHRNASSSASQSLQNHPRARFRAESGGVFLEILSQISTLFFVLSEYLSLKTYELSKYEICHRIITNSIICASRSKSFLESSGCRPRPLETSGYRPRLTHCGIWVYSSSKLVERIKQKGGTRKAASEWLPERGNLIVFTPRPVWSRCHELYYVI